MSCACEQVYTVESVRTVLEDLQKEAVSALLFLKSLQRLEVYDWGSAASEPTILYKCRLSNASPDILAERRFFSTVAARAGSASTGYPAVSSLYVAIFESHKSLNTHAERQSFLICQACGGGGSHALAEQASK